jgi:outer membrane lipoprotein-sorting protein
MIKQLIFILITVVLVGELKAQKDPEAKSLLDKVSQKTLSYKTIQAKFEYLYENIAENTQEKFAGQLDIKGKKFRIDVDNTITLCDGKNRWVYLTESNEATITKIETSDNDAPEDRFLSDPLSIFLAYNEGFKYRLDGTETIGDKEYTVVELSPEDIKKPYFKIRYWVTPENDLYMVKYFRKDGTRLTLTIKEMKTNLKTSDDFFEFNQKQYKDVEIIDMRE